MLLYLNIILIMSAVVEKINDLSFFLFSISLRVLFPNGLLHLGRNNDATEDGGEEVDIVPLRLGAAQSLLQPLEQLLQVLETLEILFVDGLLLQDGRHVLVVIPESNFYINNYDPIGSRWSLHAVPWRSRVHCNKNPIYVFLFWEVCGLSPNFHIHVSMSN